MEQLFTNVITGYLIIMNIAGFAVMGIDKRKAIRRAFRIPEKTLLLTAFLGGGIGAMLGMFAFRHKTRHMKFVLMLPLAAGLYLIVILKLYHII
jgi:uncharacterized membrane protein YsdA (DUF1294 family)